MTVTRTRGTSPVTYAGTSASTDAGVRRTVTQWAPIPYEAAIASAIASSDARKKTVNADAGTITYDSGKHKFNYCLHTSDEFKFFTHAGGAICTGYNSSGNATVIGVAGPWGNSSKPSYDPLLTITDQMRREAWQDLLPKLESGFSMINFLWELREIPALFAKLSSLKFALNTILDIIGRSGGSRSKTLAELTLIYGFALKPLVNDIISLANLLSDADKAVKDFIAKGKVPRSYHHTNIISETVTETVQTWGVIRTTKSMVYHATLRAKYAYTKPTFLEGFRRLMGLRLTPISIWNAIPFSFLVDYVLNISDWLDQFDRDMRLTVQIIDYCDSMTTTATQSYVRDSRGTSFKQASWPVLEAFPWGSCICSWTNKSYYRQPGVPDTGYALPVWDSVSLRELVFAGALARTNI